MKCLQNERMRQCVIRPNIYSVIYAMKINFIPYPTLHSPYPKLQHKNVDIAETRLGVRSSASPQKPLVMRIPFVWNLKG